MAATLNRISRLPRWMHHAYANALGYFWLPCPLCGREFGGHEWGDGSHHSIPDPTGDSPNVRWGICPACAHSRATGSAS